MSNQGKFVHKPGNGSLFVNDKKEKPTHCDFRGDAVLWDGTEVWVKLWIRDQEEGKPCFGLAIEKKDPKYCKQQPQANNGLDTLGALAKLLAAAS